MKKKVLAAGAAVAIAAVINMDLASGKQQELSSIQLANIEALALGESGGGYAGCTSGCGYCAIYYNGQLIFSSYSHYPF